MKSMISYGVILYKHCLCQGILPLVRIHCKNTKNLWINVEILCAEKPRNLEL